MKLAILTVMVLCSVAVTYAQADLTVRIKDSKTKEPLAGIVVNIEGTATGNSSDTSGFVLLTHIPNGRQVIHYRAIGYVERYDTISFPRRAADTILVELESATEEMEGVVVSSTRSSRTIQDIPTRIELIDADELNEKGNMKPGDIRMLLSESTGIQTLQTSATSGNSGIRIQGMDGRYTQILKDGFPLYAGFSGGLGLLQTPPLDLKRVEIIKGSSSTLYGGGAIAGLINLISKTPAKDRELSFLVNGTSAKGLDLNGFYAQRYGKIGLTVYGAYDANAAYAPDNTPFTAIPRFSRYTFDPRLFIYPGGNTEIEAGINTAFEKRLGGDIHYINGDNDSLHTYYEDNNTRRVSSQLGIKHSFSNSDLSIKNSVDHFTRVINMPAYSFNGTQTSTFSEISYAAHSSKLEWILGGNYFTDAFSEVRLTAIPLRNYTITTCGAFVQNTWDISKELILETGMRIDDVIHYGLAVLPRASLLYKVSRSLSTRLGGGLGYKAPTIFTEESERISYRNVLPVSADSNKLERSYGGNWDLNYKTSFMDGKVTVNLNQLFFYTHLDDPLMLTPISANTFHFENVHGHIDAQGSETNVKMKYKYFQLFLGYTYTHAYLHKGNAVEETPLTPVHHTNSVLMYELEGNIKVGAEAYYYSRQRLSDGTYGRDYWLCGLMAEKTIKKASFFINFENMLDSRQTRFDNIYTGSLSNPQFRDIYAPLDGFVMNGGVKVRL
jgi:outer membrane receptor for ferrienterochelin and colicins